MAISELQQAIEGSRLSDEDKALWLDALEILDDEHAQTILEAIQEDPEELDALTREMKLKQAAFSSGDESLQKQILEDEKNDLLRP